MELQALGKNIKTASQASQGEDKTWTRGPWTQSKVGVGSMDPWSMLCPHPKETAGPL